MLLFHLNWFIYIKCTYYFHQSNKKISNSYICTSYLSFCRVNVQMSKTGSKSANFGVLKSINIQGCLIARNVSLNGSKILNRILIRQHINLHYHVEMDFLFKANKQLCKLETKWRIKGHKSFGVRCIVKKKASQD